MSASKIFFSHSDDLGAKNIVKLVMGALGKHLILVETEIGGDPPHEKPYRLMKECCAILAICTCDLKDRVGKFSPRHNVVLEINHWLAKYDPSKMVIIKEKTCELPSMLGNPTYIVEFEKDNMMSAILTAVSYLDKIDTGPESRGTPLLSM